MEQQPSAAIVADRATHEPVGATNPPEEGQRGTVGTVLQTVALEGVDSTSDRLPSHRHGWSPREKLELVSLGEVPHGNIETCTLPPPSHKIVSPTRNLA